MTVQADFYHLTRSPLTAVLPPLLETPDWLPHGTAATPHPEWQPIYITDQPANPADAAFLFLTHGAACDDPAHFRRIFDLFDGNDEDAVAAARDRWRRAKDAGWTLAYWKQGESGWEKAA
jgi:DNA polymerase-3 subunit chi